jgi:hypothetical protein
MYGALHRYPITIELSGGSFYPGQGIIPSESRRNHKAAIFVAQIAYASVEQEAFADGWLLLEKMSKPLHHVGGATFAILEGQIDATPPDIKEALAAKREEP